MAKQTPIRILHIVTYMGLGGLETMIMNVYRNIDREKLQFDFLVHRAMRSDYDDEIESLGGKIHRLPRLNPFDPGYHRALNRFFQTHPEYRIVHCHQDCLSAIPLSAAARNGVPVRIAHSHTTNQDRNLKYLLKAYYMKKIPAVATHFFACSREAGAWMFPNQPVTVVNNGIETARFLFSPEVRSDVRRELGLQDAFIVGHVGNFSPTKNHSFILDIFKKVHEAQPNSRLLLVGIGPLEAQIRAKAQTLGLDDSIRFLGLRPDANRLYQAMDVFVMPSLYEGLGIAAIEAQASGLSCILSDSIPACCKLADCVDFVSLEHSADAWAEHILAAATRNRQNRQAEVAAAGYDIQTTVSWLQDFYLENWNYA